MLMDIFVARQPIFDIENNVVAYELLFRNSCKNNYADENGDNATLSVINNLYTLGIKNITGEKYAFINFTENLLRDNIVPPFPPNTLVIEILETVEPCEEIILQCRKLKNQGYIIALDDFVFDKKYNKLIEFADIIKIDFTITIGDERKNIFKKVNSKNVKFLAEKVETIEDFNEAKALGYSYFQGYYFSKPTILSGKDIPQNRFANFKILEELNNKNVDIENLEKLILSDLSISFKLLKLMNSSLFGLNHKITSIKYAITFLGKKNLIKWLYIVLMSSLANDKPHELINLALVRAQFAELLTAKMNLDNKRYDAYITGMLSLIHVILNKPIKEIIEDLSLSDEVKNALLGKDNILNSIIKLIIFYEKGLWDKVDLYLEKLNIDKNDLVNCYIKSLNWIKHFNRYELSTSE